MRRARQAGSQPWALGPLLLALVIPWMNVERIDAGSFISVNESLPNAVTHPSNYDPTVGGVVTVTVCIDPAAPHAAMMETPVKNVVRVINELTPRSPNLFFGASNNIPAFEVDFESLALHEIYHCIGVHHPNLGVQFPPPPGPNTELTNSGDGTNNKFSFDEAMPTVDSNGVDDKEGSSDDNRSDDVNFHWFVDGVNNPFAMPPATIDITNYTRDVGKLPAGHNFPANAGRAVGAALGFPNTEAVMQQGSTDDEDQRTLQADDVATVRFARSGLDEIQGTSDDYTINMVYAGLTTSCDILVNAGAVGFGQCATMIAFTDPLFLDLNHLTITSAVFTYEPGRTDWFFNPVLGPSCHVGDNTLPITGTDTGIETYEACVSISISTYTATASSTVTARAPLIVMENDTTLDGTFVAENVVP